MRCSSSLRTTILAATIAMLGVSVQARPMPTHTATIKSIVHQNTTEARWGSGWRTGAWGYPDYGYPSLSYYDGSPGNGYGYSGSYCPRPLAATPANKVQNRDLWNDPIDRLPWTD
jgi:hypothetical protein